MPKEAAVTAVRAMDTSPVSLAAAVRIEAAEARAWVDCYAAAPAEFAEQAGLLTREVGGAAILGWAATERRYFSRAIGLGVAQPATPEHIDEIIDGYATAGISMFLLQSLPHCRPANYEGWLCQRGLEPFDAQDRVFRAAESLLAASARSSEPTVRVEPVTVEAADEWAGFLQSVYRLDTGRWLQRLIGRPGWHAYVARREDEIVGARTMFIGPDGLAWLGMDGPVPGVTTGDYEPDAALCEFIVEDGLALGARGFVADIEAPAEAMDTPAYEYFARLGFRRPYVRTHYARV